MVELAPVAKAKQIMPPKICCLFCGKKLPTKIGSSICSCEVAKKSHRELMIRHYKDIRS